MIFIMQTPPNIPIFVINLKEATDRQAHITQLLKSLSLPFTFIDAVDGRAFDMSKHEAYHREKRLRYFGRDLTGGELGCTLSHKKIYDLMIKDDIKQALILEDDILLHDGFVEALQDILSCPVPYDMVRFFGTPKTLKTTQRKIFNLPQGGHLSRLCATPGGTYAYIITQTGAGKLLPYLQKNIYPIDALVGRSWKTGLNWLAVMPLLAYVDFDMGSFIGEKRFDKNIQVKGAAKALYPFTRGWFKLAETLGKKYWYYKNYFKDQKIKNAQIKG